MPVTFSQIEAAEQEIEQLRSHYLRRWGWEHTCMTPGSYWLWRRDFSDDDARRKALADERASRTSGDPARIYPYGIVTAPTDLAVSMTVRCLDEQPELAEDEDAA